MTVREVIELLNKARNPQARVKLEGCDCFGNAGGMRESRDGNEVLLTRTSSYVMDWDYEDYPIVVKR